MKNKTAKAAWLTSLGAGLEYYDFIIYGLMAAYLGPLFFPGEDAAASLLKTFGIFALGYLVRPIGGVFFGSLGDLYGRKSTFLAVMLVMALSTFAIGLLPNYSQAGIWSPLLLILFRILQGISFGAELPGAITVICEYAQKSQQSSYTGYVVSSMSLGSILASAVLFLLSLILPQQQILDWGWRIPFLFGGLLALASYFIRKHLGETPEFTRSSHHLLPTNFQDPLKNLAKFYKKELILGIGLTWLHACLVIFYLYLPTYLSQNFDYFQTDIYFASMCGMIMSALSLPFAGVLSDKIGKTSMLMRVSTGFLFLCFGLFQMLHYSHISVLVFFMMLYQVVISFLVVSYLPLLSGLFPTRVRYTGIALCYNLTYSVMGCSPILVTFLIDYFNISSVAVLFLLANSCITAISSFVMLRKKQAASPTQT